MCNPCVRSYVTVVNRKIIFLMKQMQKNICAKTDFATFFFVSALGNIAADFNTDTKTLSQLL